MSLRMREATVADEQFGSGGVNRRVQIAPLRSRLVEVAVEEIERHLLQLAGGGAGDAVSFLRVEHELELLTGQLQGVGHLQGVLKEDVVVFEVVEDEQLALEVLGLGRQSGIAVA